MDAVSLSRRQESQDSDVFTCNGWRSLQPREVVGDSLHRRPFRIAHDLHENPLFSHEALLALSREIMHRPEDVYFDAGDVAISDKWGSIPVPQMSLPEVVSRVETAGAWIIMKHVEKSPAYAEVLDKFATFIRELVGPERSRLMLNPEMLIIINSPHRLTPLHFDAEINFLVQVAGSKQAWICDPMDRNVVTERDLERYYGATDPGTYRPAAEENATCFTLEPGEAVHIPTHSAHWVRNGDRTSVSLSLNFEFPGWMHRDLYRANNFLRNRGFAPRPRGASPTSDRMKAFGVGTMDRAREAVRRMLKR
jgi:hypothetical protein